MSRRLPRLAVAYNPDVLLLQLVEASRGVWETIWLVDWSQNDAHGMARILKRLGPVVDVTDLSVEESSNALAAYEPSGIIAFAEHQLMQVARIAGRLGLPGHSPETVERLTNKLAQRRALHAAAVPIPRFWALSDGVEATALRRLADSVGYPAIVKPLAGAGSRDTYRVPDAATLIQLLAPHTRSDRIRELIIEELLPDSWCRDERPYADFVSVESILTHGQISHLAVTGRATLAEPFRETGNFIPTNLPRDTTQAVIDMAGRAVSAMEATTGVFHTEVKVTPDGPRVIEVNGRVGGAGIPEILALAGGHSVLNLVGRVALGEAVRVDNLLACPRVGYSMIVPPPIGATRVARLGRIEKVSGIPGVDAVLVNRGVGEAVDWREGLESRIYTVLGAAEDHEVMWSTQRRVRQTVDLAFA